MKMMNRKKVYLAGPMRGYPGFNFPMFDKAKEEFGDGAWEVVSPADMDREIGFDGLTDEGVDEAFVNDAMRRDITEILTCHAICLLPGWENSVGAQCEYSVATNLGLDILMYTPEEGVRPFVRTPVPGAWEQRRDALRNLSDATQEQVKDTGKTLLAMIEDPNQPNDWPKVQAYLQKAGETRVTSDTGGQKGQKQAQLGALDPYALMEVARVAGFGTQKYARYNFLNGYDWSLSYDAMQRHLHSFWSGVDLDDESGLPHLAHAAWHCLALMAFGARRIGTDDRPK